MGNVVLLGDLLDRLLNSLRPPAGGGEGIDPREAAEDRDRRLDELARGSTTSARAEGEGDEGDDAAITQRKVDEAIAEGRKRAGIAQ